MIRQYSLCGSCSDTSTYEIAVKREPESRGGSKFVHESLNVGSLLSISAPRNHFTTCTEAQRNLLVAGGIGITPIISMARQFHRQDRAFELLYFTRSETHTAFRDELGSEPLNSSCRLLFGLERDAVEATLDDALRNRHDGCHLYLCGPQPFMDTVRMVAARHGWPDDAVHLEYFAAAAHRRPSRKHPLTSGSPGRTRRSPSRRTKRLSMCCESMERTSRHPASRESAGHCIVKVLEGCLDHRDYFLLHRNTRRETHGDVCIPFAYEVAGGRFVIRSRQLRAKLIKKTGDNDVKALWQDRLCARANRGAPL